MNYGFEKSTKRQGYSYTYKGTRLFSLKKISAPDNIYHYTEKIEYGKQYNEFIICCEGQYYNNYVNYVNNSRSSLNTIKTYTDEIFKEQMIHSGTIDFGSGTTDNFGLNEEIVYAYIIAHTDVSKHHQIRFIDCGDYGINKLIDKFKNIDDLYEILQLKQAKNNYANYVILPLTSNEHMSTLIIDLKKNKTEEGFLLSFDTLGIGLGSHFDNNVFKRFNVTSLNSTKIQGASGCAYLTAYFCETVLTGYDCVKDIRKDIEVIKNKVSQKFEDIKKIKTNKTQEQKQSNKNSKHGQKISVLPKWLQNFKNTLTSETDFKNTYIFNDDTIVNISSPSKIAKQTKSLDI